MKLHMHKQDLIHVYVTPLHVHSFFNKKGEARTKLSYLKHINKTNNSPVSYQTHHIFP